MAARARARLDRAPTLPGRTRYRHVGIDRSACLAYGVETLARSSGHRHVVLVIDDYDDTREALVAVLRGRGFDVVAAWSAEDALRHFREGLRPCVALLDLRMPGMDGWQLWARMQDEPDPAIARLPVVIVSGDTAERDRAGRVGVREFLTKPVPHEQLIAVVERYCTRQSA